MKMFSPVWYLFVQSFEIIFPLLPLQRGSNLLSTSSTKVLLFNERIWYDILFNLKVVAAIATISINHIRVRSKSGSTELIYHMPVACRGIRWFQSFPSHMHTYTHTSSRKFFLKRCIINVVLVQLFASNLVLRHLKSLKLLSYPLSRKNDATVLYQVTDTLKH